LTFVFFLYKKEQLYKTVSSVHNLFVVPLMFRYRLEISFFPNDKRERKGRRGTERKKNKNTKKKE